MRKEKHKEFQLLNPKPNQKSYFIPTNPTNVNRSIHNDGEIDVIDRGIRDLVNDTHASGGVSTSSESSHRPQKRSLNMLKNPTINEEVYKWPNNTVLIAGDSILNGIEESRLKKNYPVKVRTYPGTTINDMYDYLTPLLKKEPSYIFLHCGSNNSTKEDSNTIMDKLLLLKLHIINILPKVIIYLSCPVLRFDDTKAGFTLHQLAKKLMSLNIDVISNDNVDATCIGKAGLHLNYKGSGRLAMNFISQMRRL